VVVDSIELAKTLLLTVDFVSAVLKKRPSRNDRERFDDETKAAGVTRV